MASLFEKAKRKLSGDSPKEGQKESKQTKMVAIPLTGITEAEQDPHEGDLIGTLHIIMEEIKELKQGQKQIATQISEQIDTKINTLRDELKKEINTQINHSENYVMNECTLLNDTIPKLSDKVDQQAKEIEQLKICAPGKDIDPLKNTDVTVVVSGLPKYPQENPLLIAEDLVANLGSDSYNVPIMQQVKVVKAARLPHKNMSKPPLMKISFRTLDEKKLVLANKRNLQYSVFNRVFMRSSKSHEVRLLEMNTRTILDNSPLGNNFRINGMGKLVPKDRIWDNGQHSGSNNGPETVRPEWNTFNASQPNACPKPAGNTSSNPSPHSRAISGTVPHADLSTQNNLQGNSQPPSSSLFDQSVH